MQFKVPQFIERKPKIVGPLTFKQFLYFGFAGVVSFILYFSASLGLFIFVAILLFGIAALLAFVKIANQNLPTVLMNFLSYSTSPRMFLWRKKALPPKFAKKPEGEEKEKEKGLSLKVSGKSQLNRLSTKVETQVR